MQEVLILAGISGSGKSTFARQFCKEHPNYLRISRDELRKAIVPMSLSEYWKAEADYARGIEKLVTQMQTSLLRHALKAKWNILIDNTHLQTAYIEQAIEVVDSFDTHISFRLMDTPLDECIARDRLRPESVGEQVIRQQHQNLQTLRESFDFTQEIYTPRCRVKNFPKHD